MKWKTTLALFIIVVILSALVYFFEGRKDDDENSTKNKSQIKLTLPPEKITKLEITYNAPGTAILTLTRDEKGIWQSSPVNIGSETINNFVAKISKRFIFYKVADPGSLSEYGLENPRIMAKFYLDDDTTRMIKIGNEIPTGNYVYMNVDVMPDEVFYVISGIINDFAEFAQKQIENNEGT